ncbi:hypothetical protein CBR_g60038 [Chara braunii]|uniref:Uncharacterized protein n=1 Tax=Chara braunii TaxID=69332 RepID=A0A388K8P6_CHABU|nr:hypothetical protein CBR_g60038 [Chara braunii]|eukprot:GBG66386.1 hypothetical protein CBR_g60038 [Chara braunii]
MLVEEYDRLYVVFNGENLADNTIAVFPASSPSKPPRTHAPSPAKPAAAARSKSVCSSDPSGQAVSCFDVADEDKFPCSQWEDGGVTSVRGATYKDKERNPAHIIGLLENFCRVGQTIFFFGKAHASVVWELLRSGRNVVALGDEAKMIGYLYEFVKTRVGNPRHHCSFVRTTGERNWDPKRDMYWKLPEKKRMEVWEFLFQPGPPAQTNLEYNRRRNLVFGVLNGYHGAPKESVSNFLKRLEHVFFLMAEPLTLENYKAQFDEEDPFDAEDMEEMSDSETFDFESMPLPRVVAQVDDEGEGVPRRYSTSPAGLKRVFQRETVEDQSSDDGEEERDYEYEPGDKLPKDHDTWDNDRLFFYGKHHRFTAEDVWGHNVIWYPRKFQPTVKTGKWVMAMKEAGGKWSGLNGLGAGPFKKKVGETLVEHLSVMNPERSRSDVNAYAGQKLDELYDNKMLEFQAPFYTLETAPSRGIDWRMPQPPSGGQHPEGGGRGDGGDGAGTGGGGDGGDGSGSGGDEAEGKGPGETSSKPKGSGGKWSDEKGSGGKGSGGKGSGGKGPGGKGPGGKRHRDSDMRDEAALRSYQVRVHSHLSARTLFHDAGERKVLEGPDAGVLETGPSEYECYASEGASIDFKSKSAADPGEELSQDAHVVHREENTQHWPPRGVLDGLDAGVLETGAREHLRHPSEGASVDLESKSTPPPGEGELSQEAHAVQREEETQHWPPHKVQEGLDAGVFETGASEHQCHASEGASGDVKGGQWTFVEGKDRGREGRAWTFGEARLRGDEEGEEEPVVETRLHDDDEGEEPVGEAQIFGGEVSAQLHDDKAGEETVGEAQLYAGCRLGFMPVRCRLVRWVWSEQIMILRPPAAVKSKVIERLPSIPVGKWCFMKPRSWLATQLPSSWLATQRWLRCRTSNPPRMSAQWRDKRPVPREGLPSTVRFVNSSTRVSVDVQLCGHPH